MAILIQPDGTLQTIHGIQSMPYESLRTLVDGPTEYVYFDDGRALIVNEEFGMRKLPINIGATCLLQEKRSKERERLGAMGSLVPELSADTKILGPAILVDAIEMNQIKDVWKTE